MKKHTLLLLLIMIIAISFSACKDDESSPTNNDTTNIPESEFPTTATGGDPRGTYTPNTPAASTKLPAATGGYSFVMSYTKNTGSGTLKLEGASATSGTYTNTNLVLEVEGAAKVMMGSTEILSYPFPSDDPDDEFAPFSSLPPTGTWRVDGNTLIFNDDMEGLGFAVTSKGLFAVHSQAIEYMTIPFGTATISIGLRKQ